MLRVAVLGPLRAWQDGVELDLGPPARRAVLGLLVLAGGGRVPRSELMDALWGDRPPASAANVLQTHVKHLRRLLEPGRPARTPSAVLVYVNGGYAVRADAVDADLGSFRRNVDLADIADRNGDIERVAVVLQEALTWWRGHPLADIASLATHPKVVSLVAEHRLALIRYGEAMIATGAAAEALPTLSLAAAERPLDERLQAVLINVNRAAGHRAAAFAIFDTVRHRLADELGVSPGPELRAAHVALLRDAEQIEDVGPAKVVAPAQLPANVAVLSGRSDELRELDGLLPATGSSGSVPVVTISGSAGVGKTALAVHWAHRVRQRFPDGQLFANLRGHGPGAPARPIEVLAAFLFSLGIPADHMPVDLEAAAAQLRTVLAGRRVLIVLDNAAGADQVRPFLPGSQDSMVVVTSRERMVGLVARDGARHLAVDVLSQAGALDLLSRVLGTERVEADRAAAVELVRLCAHLPLALRIAAAKLADHPHGAIADHVLELRAGNPLSALEIPGDEQTAVRVAFNQSYGAMPPEEQRLFRLLGLVPGVDVSADAVAALAGTDVSRAAAGLNNLARAHLVEQDAPGRFRFHDLLRHYAVERALGQDTDRDRRAALAGWVTGTCAGWTAPRGRSTRTC